MLHTHEVTGSSPAVSTMKETGFICQINPVSFNEVAFAGLTNRKIRKENDKSGYLSAGDATAVSDISHFLREQE